MNDMEPCADCKDPEHCTGTWPDEDKHRPGEVRGCFAEKSRTVMPRSLRTEGMWAKDVVWEKDADAYRRLRGNGLQPSKINGCRALEHIDHGHVIEAKPDPKLFDRYEIAPWAESPKAEVTS